MSVGVVGFGLPGHSAFRTLGPSGLRTTISLVLVFISRVSVALNCDWFQEFELIHPHNEAQIPIYQGPTSKYPGTTVLFDVSSTINPEVPLTGKLPQIKFDFTVIVDGESWGTVHFDILKRGGTLEGALAWGAVEDDTCHEDPQELAELKDKAYAEYQAVPFGSDESKELFRRWTNVADRQKAVQDASESGRCKNVPEPAATSGSRLMSLTKSSYGTTWDVPGLEGNQHKIWASIEVQGFEPGNHTIALSLDSCKTVTVELSILSNEQLDLLPFVQGTFVRENSEAPANVPYFSDTTVLVLAGFPRGARESLMNSIRTWLETHLLQSVQETIIFIQEIMETDHIAIPRDIEQIVEGPMPVIKLIGSSHNIGIGRAMWELVSQAKTKFVIFLEDDWILPYSKHTWFPVVALARRLVAEKIVDVARMKSDEMSPQLEYVGDHAIPLQCSRFQPPDATHFFCACLDEQMQGGWPGGPTAFHDLEMCVDGRDQTDPHTFSILKQLDKAVVDHNNRDEEFDLTYEALYRLRMYCMPSRICKYTNTPTLFSRNWFLRTIGPTAFVDPGIAFSKHFLEETVNVTWPRRPFKVAVPSSGIFVHTELDDKSPGAPIPSSVPMH